MTFLIKITCLFYKRPFPISLEASQPPIFKRHLFQEMLRNFALLGGVTRIIFIYMLLLAISILASIMKHIKNLTAIIRASQSLQKVYIDIKFKNIPNLLRTL